MRAHTPRTPPATTTDRLLRRWLAERQTLLSRYWTLSNALRTGASQGHLRPRLDRFCELLVDYLSAGHFEVYRELVDAGGGAARAPDLDRIYRCILATTAAALDFNDRYFRASPGAGFAADLSRLGQALAARFDWEDALIGRRQHAMAAVA